MEFSSDKPCLFVNPAYLPMTGQPRPVIDPATLEIAGTIAAASEAEIDAVLTAAAKAQKAWKALDAKARAKHLHGVANAIEAADLTRCAELMVREMGKPYPEAIGEIANCAPVFRYYAEMARDEAGKIAGTTQVGSFQYARYEPYGISVHIMPYNFPVLLMCWTVAASLAAGNACIIKPAEATTLSTLDYMAVFRSLPEGLVSCLPGGAETGRTLVESDRTHAVAPLIVSAHAPLEVAAAGSVTAAFHLSGQVCTSAERFFVVDSVHDRFIDLFAEKTRALRIGNGMDETEIGPLVSEAARAKVMRLVDDAIAHGAKAVTGGRIPPQHNVGWFYEPTILTGVTPDMAICREECFGPVAAICRVADFDEAIRLANDSPFGLGASIFTTDLAEAMEASERLEAGMVWVNNPLIDNDALPFGGWKASGIGRELGRQGLDAFRRSKMVIIDHKPVVQDWWYPYPDEWFRKAGGRKHV
jgi:acyl-CoA reductase-like NAD-dependent aldehyde dehydrogenase